MFGARKRANGASVSQGPCPCTERTASVTLQGTPAKKSPAKFSLKLERLLCVPGLCSIPVTATSLHWPPHGCHSQCSRTPWVGTAVEPGDARSTAVPCASSAVHGPCAVSSRGRGRRVGAAWQGGVGALPECWARSWSVSGTDGIVSGGKNYPAPLKNPGAAT